MISLYSDLGSAKRVESSFAMAVQLRSFELLPKLLASVANPNWSPSYKEFT
eukprot:CAMPEP_0202440708 /NCGR_PEP_ID=MMETSP1345-20130828/36848_1 /ASSEMBLY_ACC=CAM_ASM_000843 /TAXON_ID=342563 /ORGANISM="Fabrea Fabrea salina" /LENGTH=50 /DNA_ID=CAMNT_0049055337 /DNA_START=822 /DNA_END=974 /DNA_ORIENTATION=+